MLDATRKKLREADFFYRQLASEEGHIFKAEPEARDFYLSAFLSAARSVGDVIEAEEGDRYRQWFVKREPQLSDDERVLLKFTNDQRVQSVHVRGPNVNVKTTNVPIYELQRELSERGGSLQIFGGGVPGAPLPLTQAEKSTLTFAEREDEPVTELCRRYLGLLSRLINEYEQQVSPPNNTLERPR